MNSLKAESWIYHICQFDDWCKTEQMGHYSAPSLETEGFIHCSRSDQVLDVANFLFKDTPDLVLMCIDPERVETELRWEKVGEQVFPHLYGPINLDAVKSVREFLPDTYGVYRKIPDC